MRRIIRLAEHRHMSAPTRLRIEYADPRDTIDLPFSLARQAERETDAGREPDDPAVVRAIFELLYESTSRMTGGQIVGKLCHGDRRERGFSSKNVTDNLTALANSGRLRSYTADPGDGLGRGYGLPEWDKEE